MFFMTVVKHHEVIPLFANVSCVRKKIYAVQLSVCLSVLFRLPPPRGWDWSPHNHHTTPVINDDIKGL